MSNCVWMITYFLAQLEVCKIHVLAFKLLQVYSHYPCEKPLMERVFVKSG